jgi:hypothetical protein
MQIHGIKLEEKNINIFIEKKKSIRNLNYLVYKDFHYYFFS